MTAQRDGLQQKVDDADAQASTLETRTSELDARTTDLDAEQQKLDERSRQLDQREADLASATGSVSSDSDTASDTESDSVFYANCTEARAAGAAPVMEGDPGYSRRLDRDDDDIGCE